MRSSWIPIVLLLAAFHPASAQPADETDRTLSPYFFVRDGDPAVDRLPLESTAVEFRIAGAIADVTVRQTYRNEGSRPIHAQYVFPASTRAAVHGMRMIVGGRMVEAEIRERKQAKREFEQAKQEGKNAALLEQDRPNVFRMNVANVMPGDRIEVELEYAELLVPTDGLYEFVYPTVVGPRYSSPAEQRPPETNGFLAAAYLGQAETPASTLTIEGGLETGMPLREVRSDSHELDVEWTRPDSAHVWLKNDELHGGNRDFILRYRLADEKIASGLMLQRGESENFFLLMVEPPRRPTPAQIPPREYVFVVDVSGSMGGFPLDTAKTLLEDLAAELRPIDDFNVVLFAGGARVMAPRSLPATPDNVARALEVIDRQGGGGGTELMHALRTAMSLPQDEGFSRSIVIVTDGYVSCEQEAFRYIRHNLGEANVFAFGIGSSVNRFLIEGIAKAGLGEPFVVTGPAEAKDAADRFREYVGAPVLTDITLSFDGFEAYDLEPPSIPDVLADRPILIHGKWRGEPAGSITLSGVSGDGPYSQSFDVAATPADTANGALAYLWARTRIANLSDFNVGQVTDEQQAEITRLGLTYHLMTRYTSFFAVEKLIVRNPGGDGHDVMQPLPLPEGVSPMLAMAKGSEPGLWWIVLAAALMIAAIRVFR